MGKRSRQVDPATAMAKEAEAVLDYALTDDEKDLCQNIVVFGPVYLRQKKGWKAAAIRDFLGRAEVQREVNALQRQYEDRDGLQERTQFFAQLRVNGMVPMALNTLARALKGYTTVDGKKIEPPTKSQYDAALQVLDRANIQGSKYAGNDNVPLIDARTIQTAIGGIVQNNAGDIGPEGREKVRLLLRRLTGKGHKVRLPMDDSAAKTVDAEVSADG